MLSKRYCLSPFPSLCNCRYVDPLLLVKNFIGSRDNVAWDAEQEEEARKKVEAQAEIKMSDDLKDELRIETEDRWDKFYNIHQNR